MTDSYWDRDPWSRRDPVDYLPRTAPAPVMPAAGKGRRTLRQLEKELTSGSRYRDDSDDRLRRDRGGGRVPDPLETLSFFDEDITPDVVITYPSSKERLVTIKVLGFTASGLSVLPEIASDGIITPRQVGNLVGCRLPSDHVLVAEMLRVGHSPLVEVETGPYELPVVVSGFTLQDVES